MFTWVANSSVPHNALTEAADLRYMSGSVLSADSSRSISSMFEQTNSFLPVGVWGVNASGTVPSNYDGLLADATIDFNHSLQMTALNGGGTKHNNNKKDEAWLTRNGFETPTKISATVMRRHIEQTERRLSHAPQETSLAIVLASDWRDIGEYLSKHPSKAAIVTDAVREGLRDMRFNKDPFSLETAIISEVRQAMHSITHVQAAFNQGEAAAAIDVEDGSSVKRIATNDLRFLPTLRFVAKLIHSLELKITKETEFIVDDVPLNKKFTQSLITFIGNVVPKTHPHSTSKKSSPTLKKKS